MHTMPKELDLSAVENCVCFNLRWVTRAVTQFYDAEMRRHGIRPTQGTILESLKAKDSWNMAELSDWLGMERTTLVRNLRPLQRDGWYGSAAAGAAGLWNWRLLPKAENRLRNSRRLGSPPNALQSKLSVKSVGLPFSPISKLRRWP